jgi:probable HAF family extracellular repeat protein
MCSPGGGGAKPVILGAPTQAGTYNNVVITLHDNETPQAMASATYTITIAGAAAATPSAESLSTSAHQHYKLVDLGTLGGPHSYGSINGDGFQLLNNSGVVASYADTSVPDPNAPNLCFDPDCFVAHAFRWKDGVMTDLGALDSRMNSSAGGSINSRGWVTGQSLNGVIDPVLGSTEFRAVLWKGNEIVDLGTLGGHSFVIGIHVNDSGQVTGISDNGIADPFSIFGIEVQLRTFLWQNGEIQDIGSLGGPDTIPGASCSGQPHDVVVGASYTSFTPNASTGIPTIDPFLWKSGEMIDLGNLGGTLSLGAQCANNRGQIIGQSNLAGDAMSHAFFWENGVMTDLGTLGGDISEAIWLNDAGVVVGSADLPGSQVHHAAYWSNGQIHDLGTVSGDLCSRGRGLNARGQVVGLSSDCSNALHAFVWEEGGPMLDLNTLIAPGSGWQLTRALNINDRGEILVAADPVGVTPTDDDDLGHLVLLVPCDIGEAGCEGNVASTADVVLPSAARIKNLSTATPLTPRQSAAALRARWARQYHVHGAPKN